MAELATESPCLGWSRDLGVERVGGTEVARPEASVAHSTLRALGSHLGSKEVNQNEWC